MASADTAGSVTVSSPFQIQDGNAAAAVAAARFLDGIGQPADRGNSGPFTLSRLCDAADLQ
jgi:hypothetical protein